MEKEKIKVTPKRKKIIQTNEFGWVTTFEYRKSMNDFYVTQSNKEHGVNRFVYLNGKKLVGEIKKLIKNLESKSK